MIQFLEKLVLSEQMLFKLSRHILFWIFVLLSCVLIYGSTRLSNSENFNLNVYTYSFVESLMFMATHIFLTYAIIYYLFPKFLFKGKYVSLVFGSLIVVLLTVLLSQFIARYPVAYYREINQMSYMKYHNHFMAGLLGGFRGGLTFGGFAVAIKLVKYWYFKKQELSQLQLEKTQIELKSLKDQLHPHFLFNTLNNLYAMTLNLSGKSAEVVMRLSDLLQYMLYECKADFVSLKKEIQFVRHYIELEKLRFTDHLDLRFQVQGDIDRYEIAPLILLPLIENAFKHGVSETLEQPWISVDIQILNDQLKCRVLNSKFPGNRSSAAKSGIGLKNLRQRLSLIYPDKYQLEIMEEEEIFIAQLCIDFQTEHLHKKEGIRLTKSLSV